MNMFKTINTHFGDRPEMIRRIGMAVLFALNSSIIGLARRQISLNNKDAALFPNGDTPGDRFTADSIDANVRELEMRRAKNGAGSTSADHVAEAGTSDQTLEEQGFEVENPAEQAEKLVATRTLLLYELGTLIKKHKLNPLQDQSIARQILWQIDLPYREDTAKITEAVKAAGARANIEGVRAALKADWENLKRMRLESAPELIITAENFGCAEIEDEQDEAGNPVFMTVERYYEAHLDALSKLRLLSAAWGKCQKFITVDIPAGKLPTTNMTHEILLVSAAMNDLESEAKKLLDDCMPEYIETFLDRGYAGLPVILHIEKAAKTAATTGSKALMEMRSDTAGIVDRVMAMRRKLVIPAPGTPAQ